MNKEALKIIFFLSFVTGFFLLYVHEQICLLQISYKLDADANGLARREELYRELKFDVDRLKAPRLLEEEMKTLSLDLALPQEVKVIKIPAPHIPQVPEAPFVSVSPFSKGLMNFLGRWVDVAQAKTDN